MTRHLSFIYHLRSFTHTSTPSDVIRHQQHIDNCYTIRRILGLPTQILVKPTVMTIATDVELDHKAIWLTSTVWTLLRAGPTFDELSQMSSFTPSIFMQKYLTKASINSSKLSLFTSKQAECLLVITPVTFFGIPSSSTPLFKGENTSALLWVMLNLGQQVRLMWILLQEADSSQLQLFLECKRFLLSLYWVLRKRRTGTTWLLTRYALDSSFVRLLRNLFKHLLLVKSASKGLQTQFSPSCSP